MNNSTPNLSAVTQAFERLAAIENPVAFHLEFEIERKKLKLNQSTFQKAWTAWNQQKQAGS